MTKKVFLLMFALCAPCAAGGKGLPVVVFQPSHQSDTGTNYNEAQTCNAIVDYAMSSRPRYEEYKVWSYFQKGLHHANTGTNTLIAHTSALEDGKISGYAWELRRSNDFNPLVFISVHNNSGTGRHAVWGYIHEGDKYQDENRRLANFILEEIALATDLENRGVHYDSSAGRNDYRCAVTGKLAFYSIDENVNNAPYRVVLEIGDSEKSRQFLLAEENRFKLGAAIKAGLGRFFER